MKNKVVVSPQVAAFAASLVPEPRKKLRLALRRLENEQGALKPLENELKGYYRLRVLSYRVILRSEIRGGTHIIHCIFAQNRSIIYEVFLALLGR